MEKRSGIKIISTNKKAHFNYFLSDFLECGIELKGTEIKSLRMNNANLNDAYVIIKNNEGLIWSTVKKFVCKGYDKDEKEIKYIYFIYYVLITFIMWLYK